MKKIIFTLLCLLLLIINAQAQNCNGLNQLVLRGQKGSGVFHQLQTLSTHPHSGDASQTEILAEAWTCNGIGYPICNFRATLKYNLNQIPKHAIITSAKLYLYARTNSTNAVVGSPTYGANNDVVIKRVTNAWDTLGGTNYGWDDQTTTSKDSVVLPASTNTAQDYVAEIKKLAQFWIQNPDSNFGMQLKQIEEVYYKSMIFHSGTSPAAQQPRLEICYYTEDNYPRVFGTAYYDENGNGLFDSTETVAPYQKISISNNNFTFSDSKGYYELSAFPFGQYTVTATAPNFYTSANLVSTHNFTNFGQLIPNNIGFTSTGSADSLNVKIIPFHRFARPGFNFPCYVEYENLGNTVLNTVSAFEFDSSKNNFDSCSIASAVNFGSFIGTNSPTSIKPGQRHYYLSYFNTKTTAQIGDTVKQFANIYGGNAFAYDTCFTPVRASYDPNDIEATDKLHIQEVASGKFIEYIIRFENIGNDTAINVKILDTLPNNLLLSSLELDASSHPCKVTIKDGVLKADFKNIFLLYKSLNAIKCGGFVKFKVKPKPNVTVGTIIPNKAAIYFDFNEPIITNTATTTIINPILPVNFVNYKVEIKNIGNSNYALNSWTTKSEINVLKYIIQESNDAKEFKNMGEIKANLLALNEYNFVSNNSLPTNDNYTKFYRIVAVDKDGKTTFSSIQKLEIRNQKSEINIYPNPAKSFVNVLSKEQLDEVKIIDNMGSVIKSIKANSKQIVINTKDLTSGVYIIQSIGASKTVTNSKLIIE